MANTLVKILKLKIFSKMLRMSRFIRGINLRLWRFSPKQNGQNTYENSQTEIFFKNAQNVKNYQGNKSEFTTFFNRAKWLKHLWKFSNWKFFQKCSECQEFSVGWIWGYDVFQPSKMAKTLVKILKLKIFSKMLRMSRFIRGINLRLLGFSTMQNG